MPESQNTLIDGFLQAAETTGFDKEMICKPGGPTEPTMSSRDIAELVGARHDNVRRTVERLAERGVIALPPLEEKPTDGRPTLEYVFSGERGKRDSIVVVAQLSPEFTARLVDRWQELERFVRASIPALPATYAEALRALADESEAKLALVARVEADAPKVAFAEQVAAAPDAITTAEAAKLLGTGRTRLMEFLRKIGWVTRAGEPYQAKIEAGLLNVKVTHWEHPRDGLRKRVTPLVTGKGLAKLHLLYQPVAA